MLLRDEKKKKRYLYLKRGDVADELRVLHNSSELVQDGPLSYISQFVNLHLNSPVKILSFERKNKHCRFNNCEAHTVNTQFPTLLGKLIGNIKLCLVLMAHLMVFLPNRILSAYDGLPLWLCFAYSRITNAHLVHTRHNSFDQKPNSPLLTIFKKFSLLIDKVIYNKLDNLIVHGKYIEDQALSIVRDKSKVVTFRPSYRNFFQQSLRNRDRSIDYTEGDRYKIVLFVGRITDNKGVFDLFDAVLNLLNTDPYIRLLYIGDGPDTDKLRQSIEKTNHTNSILYIGKVANSLIGSIIFQSSFVITPTRSVFPEAFCKAAVEPLILGVPVIAPNFGPFPYFIKDGVNGLMFEPDSVEDLTRAIHKGLTDTELYPHLCQGAMQSGEQLIDPDLSFTEALKKTLN